MNTELDWMHDEFSTYKVESFNDVTLKEVFDEHLQHVKFDRKLFEKLRQVRIGFVSKNPDHLEFFGGKLMGVQRVRFTNQEFDAIYGQVLKVDVNDLYADFVKCEAIVKDREVAGDLFNFLCMYVTHRFLTSTALEAKLRILAAKEMLLLFNYRTLTALMTRNFKYLATPELAQRVYDRLSARYKIKQLKSWQEVMEYRCDEVLKEDSIHYKTLVSFKPDEAIVYSVTDGYNRHSDMMKHIYGEMMRAQEEGDRLNKKTLVVLDAQGEEVIRDKTDGYESYYEYLNSVLSDKNSLIKPELLSVVYKTIYTAAPELVELTLDWITDNLFSLPDRKKIDYVVRMSVIHSFEYLDEQGLLASGKNDIGVLLVKLRGMYMSSRSTDKDLLEMRSVGEKIVITATGRENEQTVAAVRTAMFIYLFLRAYSKNFYVK